MSNLVTMISQRINHTKASQINFHEQQALLNKDILKALKSEEIQYLVDWAKVKMDQPGTSKSVKKKTVMEP